MTKTTNAAASPAIGTNMTSDAALALDAAADQLASLSVSGETKGEHKNENATRPNADMLADDPDLWKPGHPPEDCPVCMMPLPIANDESAYFPCCGKVICSACVHESRRAHNIINSKRAKKDLTPVEKTCAFCRTPYCYGNDANELCLIQMEKGDHMAFFYMAGAYRDGTDDLPKDESNALELLLRAAELGSPGALAFLGDVYEKGDLGVKTDMRNARRFYEEAAKRGSLPARFGLGEMNLENNNIDLAIRHWKIAAEGGDTESMETLWDLFYQGELSKAELEETLRAHQTAFDERFSKDRKRLLAYEKAMEDGDDVMLIDLYRAYYEGLINAKELNKALKIYKSRSA